MSTLLQATLAEIALAQEIYHSLGSEILADEALAAKLAAYRAAITKTYEAFAVSGVGGFCAACAGRDQISCCFDGAEWWFGHRLLLLNLLMGVELPTSREVADQCLFLGAKGCKLIARFGICINFFCPDLREHIGAAQTKVLRKHGGDEVWLGAELENDLMRWLKAHPI